MTAPRSSREAAEHVFGAQAVEHHALVDSFYNRYGHGIEEAFARAVGGRVNVTGPDITTRLGEWAFCTQRNTKNSSGAKADLASVETGFAVQAIGIPRPGWISGVEFLARHGIEDAEAVAERCLVEARRYASGSGIQLSLATDGV